MISEHLTLIFNIATVFIVQKSEKASSVAFNSLKRLVKVIRTRGFHVKLHLLGESNVEEIAR